MSISHQQLQGLNDTCSQDKCICNYIKEFNGYPLQYKGVRDYKMLKWLAQTRAEGHEVPLRLINGTVMPPALGRFCHRCDSPVWTSEAKGYAFQCFNCADNLHSSEVVADPVIEGTTIDTGFLGVGFCNELCSRCENETYNIPNDRVSRCAHCKAEIFPCSCCDNKCDWDRDNNGCHRFQHTDEDPVFVV
jgi:hypothetical protein